MKIIKWKIGDIPPPIEEQLAVLNGELNGAWIAAGEPGVIINEATTARSDHDQHVNLRQKLRILDVFRSFTCHQ